MKHFKQLSTLIISALFALTACESSEMKETGNDVMDVVHNGVDLITEAGNKAADAMKSDTD